MFNIAPNASDSIIDIDQRINKLINSFNINIINENTIIGNKADVSEGLFYIYNKETKDFDWVEYCDEDVKYRDISKYELYYNVLTYNRKTNEVVAALRYFNKILFYSIDKRSFKEIQIGDVKRQPIFDSSKQDVSLEESEIVFIDTCVSDEYIYCLMLDHDQMPILIKLNIYGEFINCAYLDRPIFRIEVYDDEFVYGIGDDGTGLADIVKYNLGF